MAVLTVENVHVRFGGVVALAGISLMLRPNTIHGLIGPNGSGKTTLCNTITGFIKPLRGQVLIDGIVRTSGKPHRTAGLGISRTFQDLQVFGEMTALENVMLGGHSRGRSGVFDGMLGLPSSRREDRELRDRAMAALERVGLGRLADRPANRMSFGQQRMVELARALVAEPRVFLLDEPAAGLSPPMVDKLTGILQDLRAEGGLTVLLIEHVIRLVMSLCDVITVLDHGEKIAEGTPDQVRRNPAVIEAYLGKAIENADGS